MAEYAKELYNREKHGKRYRNPGGSRSWEAGMELSEMIWKLNRLMAWNRELYHQAAFHLGLTDSEMMIFRALLSEPGPLTQADIARYCFQSRQTINSSLLKMQAQGDLELFQKGQQRKKWIRLTEQGRRRAQATVARMKEAEEAAAGSCTPEEWEAATHKPYMPR